MLYINWLEFIYSIRKNVVALFWIFWYYVKFNKFWNRKSVTIRIIITFIGNKSKSILAFFCFPFLGLLFLFSSLFLYLSSLLQQLPQFPLCLHLNKPLKPIIRTILIYFDFQVLLNRLYINPLLRILKLPTNSNILISKATPIEIRNPKYIILQVGKD